MPRMMEETVPGELVGMFGGCYCLSFAFATLLAYAMAVFLPSENDPVALADSHVTQVIFGMPIVFYIIQLIIQIFYLSEDTVKFLLLKDREAECEIAIKKIYIVED